MFRERRGAALGSVLLLGGCSLASGGTFRAEEDAVIDDVTQADAGHDAAQPIPHDDAGQPVPMDDAGTPEPPLEPDAGPSEPPPFTADDLRLNELQLKGSHKSYHVAPFIGLPARNFSHAALTEQLDAQGVRALELDVHVQNGALEVFDSAVIDEGSNCETLAACLAEVQQWSAGHPRHVPLVVWLEARDIPASDDAFDVIIAGKFASEQLILPVDVQGSFGSVREALEREGWPRLGALRGRVMFVLSGPEALRQSYSHDFRDLDGRAMFVSASPDQATAPWASVVRNDDPLDAMGLREQASRALLVAGVLCRPNDDDGTCATRRDAAFVNGPHLLLDTYPAQVDSRDYWLDMGDARCHPLTAPAACAAALTDSRP